MEIGDYLYIIVLVIAIVTSMIGKAKKKEKRTKRPFGTELGRYCPRIRKKQFPNRLTTRRNLRRNR